MMPQTSDGNTLVPNDSNVIEINGGTLTSDLTLEIFGSGISELNTYIFDGGDITVNSGVTLTVEPGISMKQWSTYFRIYGALVADGTPSQPIYFTSVRDDTAGGDTNNDGLTTSPKPGDWDELHFYNSDLAAVTLLDNVIITFF